jgi:hypothetical protein
MVIDSIGQFRKSRCGPWAAAPKNLAGINHNVDAAPDRVI